MARISRQTRSDLRRNRSSVTSTPGYFVRGLIIGALLLVLGVGVIAIALPAATGATTFTVLTSSMEPRFPPGTMVVIRKTPADQIKPGDVITYQLKSGESTVVTHRVINQSRNPAGEYFFITKGDNNPSLDPAPVRAVQVRGVLWYSVPFLGWVTVGLSGEIRHFVVPFAAAMLFTYAAWMFSAPLRAKYRKRHPRKRRVSSRRLGGKRLGH